MKSKILRFSRPSLSSACFKPDSQRHLGRRRREWPPGGNCVSV